MSALTPFDIVEELLLPAELTFSPEEINAALANNGEFILEQASAKYIISSGDLLALIFESTGWTHWEPTDTKIYDASYVELSPTTSDFIAGRWRVATEPSLPVYVQGTTYDIYGAAAELLESRASDLSEDLESFSVFNGTFNWGVGAMGKWGGPLRMAREYRNMMRIRTGQMKRFDVSR